MLKFKNTMQHLIKWIDQNKAEFLLLVIILVVAGILRLWRIDEYLPFLGDEGRDARIVRRFLLDFDLMFVGPVTSVGDMYLGPLYYYYMTPWLGLFRLSPVGPAVGVAVLNIVTVFFIWLVGREWFGKVAGISASALFAISPIVIQLGRHSWNPNIMPFFALLSIYSIWRVWLRGKEGFWWLLVLGFAYAFVLQSHYLGLLLLPPIGVFWLFSLLKVGREQKQSFFVFSFLGFLVFIFLMSPLFIFDFKHGWRNIAAISLFFREQQVGILAKLWSGFSSMLSIWNQHLVTRLLTAGNENLGLIVGISIFVFVVIFFFQNLHRFLPVNFTDDRLFSSTVLVIVWIVVGIFGLGFYNRAIFDHYFEFMFPAFFLLVGFIFEVMWKYKHFFFIFLFGSIMVLINLSETPLKNPPNRQLQRTQAVDRKIIKEAGSDFFNFALIANNNHDGGYLYFLELWSANVKEINPLRYNETRARQLFVVCEDLPCAPLGHPKAEIANFGRAQIASEWNIDGLELFKLVPYERSS